MLQGVATVNFFADDLAAAKNWYTELLGVEPYFQRPATGPPAYVEYRIGGYQQELGLIDSRYAPHASTGAAGAVVYWHVNDVQAVLQKIMSMGANEHEPVIERGEGFITASVLDPFGNILGIMYNPHYVEVMGRTGTA